MSEKDKLQKVNEVNVNGSATKASIVPDNFSVTRQSIIPDKAQQPDTNQTSDKK